MKIYKSIFRLDYPISFSILDRLGEHLEFIYNKMQKPDFENIKNDINLQNHSINSHGVVGEDEFNLHLSLNTFNAVIEHKEGLNITTLAKHKIFLLADDVIERLDIERNFSEYERIGVRLFIIKEHPGLKFKKILDYMYKLNNPFSSLFTKNSFEVRDIGLILETKNEYDTFLKLHCGPYQENESIKYFSIQPSVKEGFIMDIDVWEKKIKIPNFKFTEFAKSSIKQVNKITEDVTKIIEEVLNENG